MTTFLCILLVLFALTDVTGKTAIIYKGTLLIATLAAIVLIELAREGAL